MKPPYPPGTILDGRYRLKEMIGAGGESYVHRAEDAHTGRAVAVRQYQSNGTEARMRWERECSIRVRSEHLVEHLDGGESGGSLYVVVEFFEGKALDEMAEETGTFLPDDRAIEIVRQVAQGLADLHDAGWVHRDLKSANVLVSRRQLAKIIDLGLIRCPRGQTIADDGLARGTLHFMSPEHFTSPQSVDQRSDLYGLGVIFYQLSTGTLPFDGAGAADVQHKILSEEPLPPRVIRPDLEPRHEQVILQLLEKDRRRRFQTARSLLLELDGRAVRHRCGACRAPTRGGMRYCPACGVDLRAARSAPAMLYVEAPGGSRWIAVPPEGMEIGRALLDPANPAVSARHARLLCEGGRWCVEDIGSTNGTRADGQLLAGRTRLSDRSSLQFADVVCSFSVKQP